MSIAESSERGGSTGCLLSDGAAGGGITARRLVVGATRGGLTVTRAARCGFAGCILVELEEVFEPGCTLVGAAGSPVVELPLLDVLDVSLSLDSSESPECPSIAERRKNSRLSRSSLLRNPSASSSSEGHGTGCPRKLL
jgi:hypothetical protein